MYIHQSIILTCLILLSACTPQNQPSSTHHQVVEKQNSTPSQHQLLSQFKWQFLKGENIKNPILQKLNHQTTLNFSPLEYDKNNLLLADIKLDPNYHLYSVVYTSGCSYTSSGLYLAKDKNEISKSIYAFSADMVNCGETTQIETALSEFIASQIDYQIENKQLILTDKNHQKLIFIEKTEKNQPSITEQIQTITQTKWQFIKGEYLQDEILKQLDERATITFYKTPAPLDEYVQFDEQYRYAVSSYIGCASVNSDIGFDKNTSTIIPISDMMISDAPYCQDITEMENTLAKFMLQRLDYMVTEQKLILIDKQGQKLQFKSIP